MQSRRNRGHACAWFVASVLALLAGAMGSGAGAQPGPSGIGFAQAEEGTWSCRADDPVTALNCARDKCRKEGQGQECWRVRWCFPSGWSGLMVVWLGDIHTTEIMCGAPSRQAARAALTALCEGNEHADRCGILSVTDPDGKEEQLDEPEMPGGKTR